MKHSQQYSPSSKSADINRLLDPSYASPASSSTSSDPYSRPTAYVDHSGNIHDPDFKYFPTLNTDSRRKRAKRGSSDFHRPGDDGYDSEAEDAGQDDWHGRSMLTSSSRLNATNKRRTGGRSLSPSHYPTNYYSYSSANTSPSYSTTPLSSSPESYQSSASSPRKLSKALPRTSFDCSPPSPYSTTDYESAFDEYDDEVEAAIAPEKEQPADRPTRKEVLKKEWASVQLSMRIGAFRMKKRLGTAFA